MTHTTSRSDYENTLIDLQKCGLECPEGARLQADTGSKNISTRMSRRQTRVSAPRSPDGLAWVSGNFVGRRPPGTDDKIVYATDQGGFFSCVCSNGFVLRGPELRNVHVPTLFGLRRRVALDFDLCAQADCSVLARGGTGCRQRLIRRWRMCLVDHESLDRPFCRIQLKSNLSDQIREGPHLVLLMNVPILRW